MSFAEHITCKLAKMGQYYSRYAFSHPDRNNFATILAPGNFSFHSQTVVLCFPFSGGSSYIVTGASQHSHPLACFHLFSFLRCTSAKCILKKPQAILLGALVMMFSYVST